MSKIFLRFPALIETGSAEVIINTNKHKFSPDAENSGKDPVIFGSMYQKIRSTFGLPMFRFKKGDTPKITFINKTNLNFSLHWHGLNTDPSINREVIQSNSVLNLNFPKIKNNSGFLWVHARDISSVSNFVYTGLLGPVEIIDKESNFLQKEFKYENNHLTLIYSDINLNINGILTNKTSTLDGEHSCFGQINGISCVNWYSDDKVKYVTNLEHISTRNLIKIDILNATISFRFIYIGVCDKKNRIRTFYQIQSDQGLMNPTPLKMVSVSPGGRVSIVVDLDDYSDKSISVFFYNYDLTQVSKLTATDEGKVPVGDNPTPITNPMNYPLIPEIPTLFTKLQNGNRIPPQNIGLPFSIKKFLLIKLDRKHQRRSLSDMIRKIRKTVFGEENYEICKNFIKTPFFEYHHSINYLSLLNPQYYYNLPNFTDYATRNLVFFSNGVVCESTEVISGSHKIMFDLWNDKELDLLYAIQQYYESEKNYKPKLLPTCLFKIYDKLKIEFFSRSVDYTDTKTFPDFVCDIKFPEENVGINLQEWVNLVNNLFEENLLGNKKISDILSLDWTFYPYKHTYLTDKAIYLKTVLMKLNNKSKYFIRLKGKWELLHYFGKSINIESFNYKKHFIEYSTDDPIETITSFDGDVSLIIKPYSTHNGFIDGVMNNTFANFSVELNSTERWIYNNLDTNITHPNHFHLTSGYLNTEDSDISSGLISSSRAYEGLLYSKDVYSLPSQQKLAYYLKFCNYNSADTNLFIVHSHLLAHTSFSTSYYVYQDRSDHFSYP